MKFKYKVGQCGYIQKSKHSWNNGVLVRITKRSICKHTGTADYHAVALEESDRPCNNFLLGEKNFKPTAWL